MAAWFPKKLESFKLRLEENKAELPFFLLFLRLFPMSPNWYEMEIRKQLGLLFISSERWGHSNNSLRALNMASGVLGVPIHLFFFSVLFGLMPYNYLCVTSGAILSEINDLGDVMSWSNMARWMSTKNIWIRILFATPGVPLLLWLLCFQLSCYERGKLWKILLLVTCCPMNRNVRIHLQVNKGRALVMI